MDGRVRRYFPAFIAGLFFLFSCVFVPSVVYADDWSEKSVTLSAFDCQRMMDVDGNTFWADADSQLNNGLSKNVVSSIGLQFNNGPGFNGDAFALNGRISIDFLAVDYGDDFTFSRCYGYLFHPDGSATVFGFSASPRWTSSNYYIDMDIDAQSSKTVVRVAMWMEFPSNLGGTRYVYNGVSDATVSNLVVGYGSSLSPTFPGSGLSRGDIPADTVSGALAVESSIMGDISTDLDSANSLISGLPDQLASWRESLSFVRKYFGSITDALPWASDLLTISLTLGVIALLLNLSGVGGRLVDKLSGSGGRGGRKRGG